MLAAQAWHWVDPARAVPEVARVLVPGGQLGLVWNMRDDRADWVAQLSQILHDPGESDGSRGGAAIIGPPFGPVQHRTVEWTHRLTRDQLLDMVASRSYIITMPAAERAGLLAAVGQAGRHPPGPGRPGSSWCCPTAPNASALSSADDHRAPFYLTPVRRTDPPRPACLGRNVGTRA